MAAQDDLTEILRQVAVGQPQAVEGLFARVYDELHRIARAHFRDQPADHTLQPTVLIHEAFLRLMGAAQIEVRDRSHFFALASRVMRQLLVDHCREQRAAKRGGGWAQITLSGTPAAGPNEGKLHEDALLGVLDLDEALSRLAEMDARKAKVVELRFFGGLPNKEIAEALDVSERTVESDWAMARAWLKKELD
jgi:RNA polymerase sigma factor (TIGR02999 family)